MGGFAILEHTADVGIAACGETLAEALSWLAAGMFSLIIDPGSITSSRSEAISVISRNRESLAVDWLNELLYQYEATGFLLKDSQITLDQRPGDTTLEALCQGDQLDPARHRILTVVKAATYHNLTVSEGRPWRISIILDV